MKKLLFILLISLFYGNISAQTVQGVVKNAISGNPVRASVSTLGKTLITEADGSFSLKNLAFPAEIHVHASGYEALRVTVEYPEEFLEILLFPASESLAEVVLRSTIIPKEILRTPASVSVLGVEEIERTDETNLVDALNTTAGVYVHQGAHNTNKIAIRGVGARSQYSSNRIKAYFMGIPLSTGEGETTLDDIDPAVVERAEVLKGPVSSVYGAGLGGAIHLYPRENLTQGTTAGAKTTFGSFGLLKNSVRANHATAQSNFSAFYNHLSTNGFRDNGEYERNSFTMNGRLAGGESHSLSLLANFVRLKAYIPSSLNREDYENDPTSAAFTWEASRGYESYDKGLLGLSYQHDLAEDFTNTSSIFMNFRNGYEPRPFDILKEEQVTTGFRTKFGLKNQVFSLPSEMSLGGEFYREWYDIATFENLYEDFPNEGSIRGGNLSINEQDRSYYNIFAQWNLSLSDKLDLEAGANLNSTQYRLVDFYGQDEMDQTGAYRFETILSPRVGAVYSFSTGKNLYASISHGFSTPTVAETLTPEGMINTRLKPETGVNYEIGFKGNFLNNQLYVEAAVFSIQVKNLLVAERVAEDQYIGRNAGKTNHNGFEFLMNYTFDVTAWLEAKTFLNASFNNFKFDRFTDSGRDFSGNALPAVPDKSIHAGFDLSTPFGLSLSTSLQHEGKMPLNDENSSYTDAYELVNLKLSYAPQLFKNVKTQASLGINNALDEHYAASIVPNAVGFGGAAPRYFYPGKPRNYFGGILVSYTFN